MKNLFLKFVPGALIACSMVSISVGQSVVVNENAPDVTDAVAVNLETAGAVFSRIFTEAGSANHARGQILTIPAGSADIASLTILKGGDQTFEGASLRLQIFEGNNDGVGFGFGHTTADDGDNYFVDTSADVNNFPNSGPIVPFSDETFAIDGLIADDAFVTLNFATPVQVSGVTELGFLLTFDVAADAEEQFFQYFENTAGNRFAVTTTAHAVGSSRAIQYALLSTTVEQEADVLVGDVNLDMIVNFLDIAPFIGRLSTGDFQREADINLDTEVTFLDIAPFISLLSSGGA